MLEALRASYRSVDRYLRDHEFVYAGTLLVVTALATAITRVALGGAPSMAVIHGLVFGVTFATLTLLGRRVRGSGN